MPFSQGDLIKAIHFESGEVIKVNSELCDFIIVSMENGQCATVAWFEVWKDSKCISKWNSAKVEGVEFM